MKKNQTEPGQITKTKVIWEEIKNRKNTMQESFNQKHMLLHEEKHSVLKARAKALAVEKKDKTGQKESIEIVVFRLASETYGIESSYIREVYPLKDYTILPGTPLFVLGIVNVRGQIISIIDLKKLFNLPEKEPGELNKVIIIHNERMEFGILADTILDYYPVSVDAIQTSLPNISGIGSEYLKGVTNEHLIILDAKKILEDKKIIINQESE
jgi:purine-binding chemotaxis protein CheW